MRYQHLIRRALAALLILGCAMAGAADKTKQKKEKKEKAKKAPVDAATAELTKGYGEAVKHTMTGQRVLDKAAVDQAFEALKTYDFGTPRAVVVPIDDAVVATHGDAAARKDLETRLAAVLATGASRAAKEYACRTLSVIGTASCVPSLAGLLADKDLSHMGRYALQRIPAAEAAQALRDALPKLSGAQKAGVVASLGARRDAASVPALAALLSDADASVACTAASALGTIGTPEAGKALVGLVSKAPPAVKPAAADASLVCAQCLVANGKKAEALVLYKALSAADQPKHVRLAATRGLLSAAGKKD